MLSIERGIGNPVPGLLSPFYNKKRPHQVVWSFYKLVKCYKLPELIRHPKSSPGVLPGNIQVRAQDPAGAAFNAALYGDLDCASVLGPVGSHGTELDAGLILAGLADGGVNDSQVQFLFVGEIFQ